MCYKTEEVVAKTPVTEQVQVNFRMSPALRDSIKVAAQANNRSMNAEIVAALEILYPPVDKDLDRLLYLIDRGEAQKEKAESDAERRAWAALIQRLSSEIETHLAPPTKE